MGSIVLVFRFLTVAARKRRRPLRRLNQHLHRRKGVPTTGTRPQQQADRPGAFRRQLQPARSGRLDPGNRRHHHRHGRAAQRLVNGPQGLIDLRRAYHQQPLDGDPTLPRRRRIEIAARVNHHHRPSPLRRRPGHPNGQAHRPAALQWRKDLGDRPSRQAAARQDFIQSDQPGRHGRPPPTPTPMLVSLQHAPQPAQNRSPNRGTGLPNCGTGILPGPAPAGSRCHTNSGTGWGLFKAHNSTPSARLLGAGNIGMTARRVNRREPSEHRAPAR